MNGSRAIGLTLFLSLFAGQAAVIAVSPVLTEVARDFDVSTATAGQLRSISGLAAGAAALTMGALAARLGLRDLLLVGLALLAGGSVMSAAAPTFGILAFAQIAVGGGLAIVLSSALAAAAAWVSEAERGDVVSWTLVGQPGAWIVGMPVIGLLGEVSWRLGWIAVPFLASVVALLAVRKRPHDIGAEPARGTWSLLRRNPSVVGWALGELLAFAAWAGTLVFAGALFVESYGISYGTAGLVLGLAAVAYLPGNFLARRWVEGSARLLLVTLPLATAVAVTALGGYRPGVWVSGVVLAILAFLGGGRTIAGSTLGLDVCAKRRVFAMRIRAAATQFGYLLGAALGGLALVRWGYSGLGLTFACLFVLAALPHALAMVSPRLARPAVVPAEAQPTAVSRPSEPERPASAP